MRIVTCITKHLADLERRIAASAAAGGRAAEDIAILGVSKRHPAAAVIEAAGAGIRRFGENYVQEAVDKMPACGDGLEWHFVGRIQSNKTRAIAENFDWVQTVASPRIAERLNTQRPYYADPLQVCVQVRVDASGAHEGLDASDVPALCALISGLPRLRLRGLMGMPLPGLDEPSLRQVFRQLRQLMDEISGSGMPIDTLSMGMSDDLEAAILEGSTMLRIGTALFGPRPE